MGRFDRYSGANQLGKMPYALFTGIAMAFVGLIIARFQVIAVALFLIIPIVIYYFIILFRDPSIGLTTTIILNFFVLGATRYVEAPFGLLIDGFLVLSIISLLFKSYSINKPDYSMLNNNVMYFSAIWFLFLVLELLNPEVNSRAAWFFFMRGMGLYMLLCVFLVLMVFNTPKHLEKFLMLWAILSFLGILKGLGQKFFGLDHWEQHWLTTEGFVTHFVFGKLRIFSFYSDAGQFGASQAHTGVVFLIIALNSKKSFKKYFFLLVALLGFWGMSIAGTRGAMAVPLAGFFLYIVLQKNVKFIVVGFILLLSIVIFFKFTTIGQGNDQIRRMRSAFDTEDNSLNVRLDNQKKLSKYLASRPFGGGVGNAGAKALRFAPNSFLANVPTDSWFVHVWAETGIVGLYLHFFIIFFILGKGSYIVMFKIKDEDLRIKMIALLSGYVGIIAASYGNEVISGLPTAFLTYPSIVFVFMADHLEKQKNESKILNP
ncbi:MAG: O-antigen ligase family protein [Bacteroidales bacterium]